MARTAKRYKKNTEKKISGIPVCMAAIYARLSVDNDEDVYKRQDTVTADGVDKRAFYVEQQQKIADFANKVHAGEITNAAGEKFTTVVQIGIGGSDLGPVSYTHLHIR